MPAVTLNPTTQVILLWARGDFAWSRRCAFLWKRHSDCPDAGQRVADDFRTFVEGLQPDLPEGPFRDLLEASLDTVDWVQVVTRCAAY